MLLGEMELVFDRLARAACLWRSASLSLPHTRGTEYVYKIQRTAFLGREYKIRWQEAEVELELLCWMCDAAVKSNPIRP